jgi:hypothetical protein
VRSEQVASIICSLRVMLRTLQGFVDSAYLGRFLFLDLPRVASCWVPGGATVVPIVPSYSRRLKRTLTFTIRMLVNWEGNCDLNRDHMDNRADGIQSSAFPTLADDQIAFLMRYGEVRKIEPGQVLFREGDSRSTNAALCQRGGHWIVPCSTRKLGLGYHANRSCSRAVSPASSPWAMCAAGRSSGWLRP